MKKCFASLFFLAFLPAMASAQLVEKVLDITETGYGNAATIKAKAKMDLDVQLAGLAAVEKAVADRKMAGLLDANQEAAANVLLASARLSLALADLQLGFAGLDLIVAYDNWDSAKFGAATGAADKTVLDYCNKSLIASADAIAACDEASWRCGDAQQALAQIVFVIAAPMAPPPLPLPLPMPAPPLQK